MNHHTGAIPASPRMSLPKVELLGLYERMLLLRHFELEAQRQYKAGRIPGFIHLYIGEEAVAAGVCHRLRSSDWITSTHRGHGHALAKGVDPKALMAELYGRQDGCCGGRGGSMHLYEPEAGLFGTNGFVGGGIPAAVGLALSARVQQRDAVAVAFFGDGAVQHGTFHESVNLAAVQNAPVIFVCENNLYATATPLAQATKNQDIAAKAAAYGIPGICVDGNDVLAALEAAGNAIDRARRGGGPALIEARTYRTVGHHEGDPIVGTYRTEEELRCWQERCPLLRFEKWLQDEALAEREELEEINRRVQARVAEAVEFAEASPWPNPAGATERVWAEPIHPELPSVPNGEQVELTWLAAVRDGIAEEMRRDPHLIYFGEGIGERGGSFAHTKGLWAEFGAERVIDTPISELGYTGAAVGAAAAGCRAVSDLMFADFLFEAASQIIQQAGKLRYMSNGRIAVPMVIRAGMGAIKNAGPHHSGTYHPVWAHCPGLIVVVPSNPADAKGLIKSALRCADPVIFLEPKRLFAMKGRVPVGEHFVPLGQARVLLEGSDLTLVSCGGLVSCALEAAVTLGREGVSCEVIDLRTIVPLDLETLVASARKTRRVLVVDEGFSMCGLGAEIAASIMERAFDKMALPVGRLHTAPVAHPFSPPLENAVTISTEKVIAAIRAMLEGRVPLQRRLRPSRRQPTITPPPPLGAPAERAAMAEVREMAGDGVPLVMPHQDLTISEGTVVRWLKQIGESVRAGEPVLEIETAKAIVPVEAPLEGILTEITAKEGTVVPMGGTVGFIRPAAR